MIECNECPLEHIDVYEGGCWLHCDDMEEFLKDRAKVIYCKDCRHRTKKGFCKANRHSDGSMRLVRNDEFCSMGTPRRGDEE